jgi:hypothetical protein
MMSSADLGIEVEAEKARLPISGTMIDLGRPVEGGSVLSPPTLITLSVAGVELPPSAQLFCPGTEPSTARIIGGETVSPADGQRHGQALWWQGDPSPSKGACSLDLGGGRIVGPLPSGDTAVRCRLTDIQADCSMGPGGR